MKNATTNRVLWIALLTTSTLALSVHADDKKVPMPILEEDVFMHFFEEPDFHFHKARERFLKRDHQGTIHALNLAAAFVKLETMYGTKTGEEGVRKAAAEIDWLAANIDNHGVKSAKQLDEVFARAHYALGRNHHYKAIEHLAHKKYREAGKQILAAVHHGEHAYLWSETKEKDDVRAIFKSLRELGTSLSKTTEAARESADKQFHELTRVLDEIALFVRFSDELHKVH